MSEPAHGEATLARFKSGDPEAFAKYLMANQGKLLAFIHKRMSPRLRQKVEAEDILQEVCSSALKSLGKCELDGDPMGWLYELAERRIRDAHRFHFESQKRAAGQEVGMGAAENSRGKFEDRLVSSITSPSMKVAKNREEQHLAAAIDRLGETQREAIRLKYIEKLPSKEIAQRLGKSDGAVRVMLARAMEELKKMMQEPAG